jgi:hypothetical protein
MVGALMIVCVAEGSIVVGLPMTLDRDAEVIAEVGKRVRLVEVEVVEMPPGAPVREIGGSPGTPAHASW